MKMISKIMVTPTTNIVDNAVVDNNMVEKRQYDSLMDVFVFFNTKTLEERRANLMDVSLYDDVIVENGVQYKILNMLTKPAT